MTLMNDLNFLLETAIEKKRKILELQRDLANTEALIQEFVLQAGAVENKYLIVYPKKGRRKANYQEFLFRCVEKGVISPTQMGRTVGNYTTVRQIETISYKGAYDEIVKMLPRNCDISIEDHTEVLPDTAEFSYNIEF